MSFSPLLSQFYAIFYVKYRKSIILVSSFPHYFRFKNHFAFAFLNTFQHIKIFKRKSVILRKHHFFSFYISSLPCYLNNKKRESPRIRRLSFFQISSQDCILLNEYDDDSSKCADCHKSCKNACHNLSCQRVVFHFLIPLFCCFILDNNPLLRR